MEGTGIYNTGWDTLPKGVLYPLLKCMTDDKAQRILREVYEGDCGDNTRGKHLQKIHRYRYFLPMVKAMQLITPEGVSDAKDLAISKEPPQQS